MAGPAEAPLILTIDVGTSSTRAMLFDRQARPVAGALAQIPNEVRTTPDGGSEFDPKVLFQNVVSAIDRVLKRAGSLQEQIAGVGMATIATNIMGISASGQPVTPVFTYADTRNVPDAEALREEFDLAEVHDRTGCRIHSSYLPARFRWLARTRPELLARAERWVSIGEYLYGEFFGELRASYSIASWTGLLDRRRLTWDPVWLEHLPIQEEQLSPLADVDEALTGLKEEWAERWPALKEIPWFPAVGDGATANLGSGCTGPDRVALTVGTTGAIRVALDRPVERVPDGLWVYRVNRRYALLGGATTEGGNIFAWLNEMLQLPPHTESELAKTEPTAHGLTVLPFIAGERAPGWHDKAQAVIAGLTLHSQPIDLLRAGLESVAYRFALIHRSIAPQLPDEHQIIASGSGLLSSPAWMQIVADVLNRPLLASAEREATSRGVALLALEALGQSDNPPAATGDVYTPNPEHHALHQAALEKQVELYQRLIVNPLE